MGTTFFVARGACLLVFAPVHVKRRLGPGHQRQVIGEFVNSCKSIKVNFSSSCIVKFIDYYRCLGVNPSHVFSSPDLNFFGELVARTLLDKHRGRFTSNKSLDNPKLVTVDLTVSPIRVDVSPLPGHDSFRLLDYASFDQGSHTVLPPDELSREVFNGLTSGGENASMLSILVPRPGDQKHWLAALMDYWATPRGGVSGPTAGICWIFSA